MLVLTPQSSQSSVIFFFYLVCSSSCHEHHHHLQHHHSLAALFTCASVPAFPSPSPSPFPFPAFPMLPESHSSESLELETFFWPRNWRRLLHPLINLHAQLLALFPFTLHNPTQTSTSTSHCCISAIPCLHRYHDKLHRSRPLNTIIRFRQFLSRPVTRRSLHGALDFSNTTRFHFSRRRVSFEAIHSCFERLVCRHVSAHATPKNKVLHHLRISK